MSTYFQGAIRSGDGFSDGSSGVGTAVLSQTALINYDNTLVQNATFTLPKGAQIVNILADVLTAFNSATSATLSVGTASGGTQYASAVNAKTAGRTIPTFSAAQLTSMNNINPTAVATVTSVGQPTAGQVRVTIQYTGGNA